MELICNELSYYPIAKSKIEAEKRFIQLLDTFKEANDKLGFKRIRFHSDYAKQLITSEKKFYEWIPFISNSVLKNNILAFFRKPFADDLEEKELESFFQSEFKITNENVPIDINPIGLPIAHIKSTLSLSFDSDSFWRNRKINLLKTNTSETENINFFVYNICINSDIVSDEIIEWKDNVMANKIDSEEMLLKYLSYTKYNLIFKENFLKQLFEWKENNISLFKYILLLMKDVQIHPFTGGMGKTENLKKRGKEASKQISQLDRLSYHVENDIVTFIACKGHYEFH